MIVEGDLGDSEGASPPDCCCPAGSLSRDWLAIKVVVGTVMVERCLGNHVGETESHGVLVRRASQHEGEVERERSQ